MRAWGILLRPVRLKRRFSRNLLHVSLEYYEAAQLKVAQRDKAKHERHMRVWQRWNRERIKAPDFINETDE